MICMISQRSWPARTQYLSPCPVNHTRIADYENRTERYLHSALLSIPIRVFYVLFPHRTFMSGAGTKGKWKMPFIQEIDSPFLPEQGIRIFIFPNSLYSVYSF